MAGFRRGVTERNKQYVWNITMPMKISRDKSERALFRDLGRHRIRELASQNDNRNHSSINYIIPISLHILLWNSRFIFGVTSKERRVVLVAFLKTRSRKKTDAIIRIKKQINKRLIVHLFADWRLQTVILRFVRNIILLYCIEFFKQNKIKMSNLVYYYALLFCNNYLSLFSSPPFLLLKHLVKIIIYL